MPKDLPTGYQILCHGLTTLTAGDQGNFNVQIGDAKISLFWILSSQTLSQLLRIPIPNHREKVSKPMHGQLIVTTF